MKNQKVLILHGWGGSDNPHWQSWLAGELAKDYGTVSFPLLDNPHFPAKNRWMRQVKELLETFKPDTVVCHSMANTLWFHLCEEGEIDSVKRLLMVAPPRLDLNLDTIKTFFPAPIPQKLFAEEAMLVTSTDDPYLTSLEAVSLQKVLNIPMKVLENAGHINADSGFGEWPWVLKWVKK
ncbi:MAG: serine hydrolase family protein [Epsilonproteobacteria bacterium]|nr:MAG: serine hydrolase family protein [Campylobacterota bacterium]